MKAANIKKKAVNTQKKAINVKKKAVKVWEIGKNYLIRTVTMANTGRVVAVTPNELVLADAAWIAQTGRFADVCANCKFEEVEPFPKGRLVIVGRGAIVDAVQIDTLPLEQR